MSEVKMGQTRYISQKRNSELTVNSSELFFLLNIIGLLVIATLYKNLGIFLVGIIGLTIFLICAQGIDTKMYRYFGWIYVIAVITMIAVYYGMIDIYGKPYYGSDDERFEEYGRMFFDSKIFTFSNMPYVDGMFYAKGYLVIIAWIIRISSIVGEYHTISPRILNLYLWFAIVALAYKYIRDSKVLNKTLLYKVTFMLGIFPNALYIASFVYRDIVVLFFLFTGMYAMFRIQYIDCRKNFYKVLGYSVIFVADMYALYYIRLQFMFMLVATAIIELFWEQNKKNKWAKRIFLILLGVIVLSTFGGFSMLKEFNSGYSDYILSNTDGLSRFIFSQNILPFGIILRFIWGLMVPFPGELLGLSYLENPLFSIIRVGVCLGTIGQILCIPYLIKSIKKLDKSSLHFGVTFLSIVISTFTFRHFITVYPFMAIQIYEGIRQTNVRERKNMIGTMVLLCIIGAILYVTLKLI